MDTVSSICEAVGRDVIRVRLSVSSSQVSNACSDNAFPSNWYREVRTMCEEVGIASPDHLFPKMKGIASPAPQQQGAA